jgi:plasmid stabilization system protein ParE
MIELRGKSFSGDWWLTGQRDSPFRGVLRTDENDDATLEVEGTFPRLSQLPSDIGTMHGVIFDDTSKSDVTLFGVLYYYHEGLQLGLARVTHRRLHHWPRTLFCWAFTCPRRMMQ